MEAYIFDLDGTLLDSMRVWEDIDIEFLQKRGITIPEDYIDEVNSLSFEEAAKYTIERFGLSDSVDDLIAEWNNMAVYAYGNTVKMKPRAKEYILKLQKQNKRLAIATSLPEVLYKPTLQNIGIEELFEVIVTTDEVGVGKSSPAVFELVAKKLCVSQEDCVVFEDVLEAVKSAKQIGMKTCGVYDESSKENWAEIKSISDITIKSFAEIINKEMGE